MERRHYLVAVAAGVGLPGCATITGTETGPVDDGPPIQISAPTVTRGETASITVDARGIHSLHVRDVPDTDLVVYRDAEFKPTPDAVYTTLPPAWVWSSATDISGEIPVEAGDSATPGTYQYTATATQGDDEEELSESFTLTIEG